MRKKQSERRRRKRAVAIPGFEFGAFDFADFAGWLIERHEMCAGWILVTAETARESFNNDDELVDAYQGIGLSMAMDMAYMNMLALAVAYSVREDLVDGHFEELSDLVEKEPFRRARFMLEFHADHLPVRLDSTRGPARSMLDKRAAVVATILVPASMDGFDSPSPPVQDVARALPAVLRAKWREHPHAESPLCQMMMLGFWLAFRGLVPNNMTRQWDRVLRDFWEGWSNHLLDVEYALQNENLAANEEIEE